MAYDLIPLLNSGIFHVVYLMMLKQEFANESFRFSSATFLHTEIGMEYTDNKNTLVIDICFRL